MRSLSLSCALLLVACGGDGATDDLAAPSGDTGTTTTPGVATWAEAFDTSATGAWSGVWGTGPSDVFVVGGTAEQAEIQHYDGASWSPMTAPALPLLGWVHGTSGSDVYAVGYDGAAAHYDGSAWTTLETPTTENLWGVFARSSTDVWMVGGDAEEGDPVVLHYDGSAFTQVAIDPEENDRGTKTLFKIFALGDTMFTVGQKGQIFQYVDGAWVNSPAGAEADQDFVSLWGTSEDHIVAVGGRSNARISSWDGTSWTTWSPSGFGGFNGVYMVDPDEAVVVGVNGWVGSLDVPTQELTFEGPITSYEMHAVWGDGQGAFYAVGGHYADPFVGTVLKRTVQ